MGRPSRPIWWRRPTTGQSPSPPGPPGDVLLCHPFLVHAAQPHHGVRPRFMSQPPLLPAAPYELERVDGAYSPVEIAIRRGLGQDTPGQDGDDIDCPKDGENHRAGLTHSSSAGFRRSGAAGQGRLRSSGTRVLGSHPRTGRGARHPAPGTQSCAATQSGVEEVQVEGARTGSPYTRTGFPHGLPGQPGHNGHPWRFATPAIRRPEAQPPGDRHPEMTSRPSGPVRRR